MNGQTTTKRRGRKPAKHLSNPDLPYTMRLGDGRTLFVEVPGRWVAKDRGGASALKPDAVRFLDRVRALATKLDRAPSPGYITSLREALGYTQRQLGEQLGVDKMTVSRWERGTLRPSEQSLEAIQTLRQQAVRRGVTIPS